MCNRLETAAYVSGSLAWAPWLEGCDRDERARNEDALISFVIVLARILIRTVGAAERKRFAIRYAHLVIGCGDPLLRWARLRSTLAGLRR